MSPEFRNGLDVVGAVRAGRQRPQARKGRCSTTSSYTASASAASGAPSPPPRPCAFINARVTSSEGKMEVVAPSSAPILVMVARSGTESVATPSPPYSMILPNAALDREAAQHFQNNVLGRDPRRELAGEVDADHLRHVDVVRAAAHGHGHVQTAGAEGQHADAAAGRGVAVRPDERFPGDAEALQMHLMADAVARAGEVNARAFWRRTGYNGGRRRFQSRSAGCCDRCTPPNARFCTRSTPIASNCR